MQHFAKMAETYLPISEYHGGRKENKAAACRVSEKNKTGGENDCFIDWKSRLMYSWLVPFFGSPLRLITFDASIYVYEFLRMISLLTATDYENVVRFREACRIFLYFEFSRI